MDTGQSAVSDRTDAPSSGEAAPIKAGGDERRMQVRAYNFWAGLLDEGAFPDVARLDPQALPDFGPRSVLLDFTQGLENPAIAWLGPLLAQECGAKAPIWHLSDVPSRSLLSRVTDHYMQILANEAPIGFEAEFVNHFGVTILYRAILMPFSAAPAATPARIDYIYGVISWKEHTGDRPVPVLDNEADDLPAMLRVPETLTDWADAPVHFGSALFQSDLQPGLGVDSYAPLDLPLPGFAFEDAPVAPVEEPIAIADWLASARELAVLATHSEERSHRTLYDAIGRAYDCALAAQDAPDEFAGLVAAAGLKVQERAPLIPLVKLVFGADYDKTRLTEFATVIGHARRLKLDRGSLAEHLAATPGGVKALVREERRLRREDADTVRPATAHARLVDGLRAIKARPLAELASEGEEFTVLVARRLQSGEVVLVGEVDDEGLLQRAARHLLG